MDVLYAPPDRLSPGASHVYADWVFGGVLLLLVFWAFALAWNAWVHASALRKETWQARGLRPGVLLLSGIAEPAEAKNDGTEPFIELVIHQRGDQRRARGGPYIAWSETHRSLSERPFHLRTDGGTLVRVEPSGKIDLIDRLELVRRSGFERTYAARISAGDRIWVRGNLTTQSAVGGPYRGGVPDATPHTLRPALDRPLFISSEPVEREERATARFHALFGLALCAALAVTQLGLFASYHALRARGVVGNARIERRTTWQTRSKHSTTMHYAFEIEYAVDGLEYGDRAEVNRAAYDETVGSRVPLVYDPLSPATMQVGTRREIGLTDNALFFAIGLVSIVAIVWLSMSHDRRPWWRRKKFNETQPGTL